MLKGNKTKLLYFALQLVHREAGENLMEIHAITLMIL